MAWRPLVALSTSISWFSSTVVRAKMLRASSSTTSTLRPRKDFVGSVEALEHLLLGFGQIGHDAVQEQRGFVKQPFRRLNVFEHDALGHGSQLLFLLGA